MTVGQLYDGKKPEIPRGTSSVGRVVLLMLLVAIVGGSLFLTWLAKTPTAPPPPHLVTKAERPWKKVLESAGHNAHLKGLQPVPCAECHEIRADVFEKPSNDRCLRCHPNNRPAVHASTAASEKVACIDCHDFLVRPDNTKGAWGCLKCHAKQQGERGAVEVHQKEACGGCHRPHKAPSLQPRNCVECHEKKESAKHGKQAISAQLCLACHQPHEAAGAADGKCLECHAKRQPTVPATALQAGKHEKCTGCHKPHTFVRTAVDCRGCHKEQRVLGEDHVREHQQCTSCHTPHNPLANVLGSCLRCHGKLNPTHPVPETWKNRCLGCHTIHAKDAAPGGPASPPKRIAAACSSCHTKAASDTAFHKGDTPCQKCHVPHQFKLKGGTVCQKCHGEKAELAAKNRGHADCTRCHIPHNPSAPRPPCATCHDEVASSAPEGHSECVKCHEPHEGARRAGFACTNCHKDRGGGPHGKIRGGCINCHKPHGPNGSVKPPACTTCHDRSRLPSLHSVEKHGDCRACHSGHAGPRIDRATCTACHTDKKNHEPKATQCSGCHTFGAMP